MQSTSLNTFFQIIIEKNQMQQQKRILSACNNNQINQEQYLIIRQQPERIALIQRRLLQNHSADVKARSEGSLQLSRSSVSSRERKANKKIELKQSLQFVLQQDDHVHYPQQATISKSVHQKQIQISLNFIAQALDNHQFPQARTEIVNFIKQTKKYSCTYDSQIKLLSSVSTISSFIQNTLNTMKVQQQQHMEIKKSLQFANKFFRQDKWFEMQKVKLKLLQNKSSKLQLALGLFLQSIINNNSKIKPRQSPSIFMRPKEKLQNQKVTELEMDNLKKQISKLTVQLQKQRIKSSNIQSSTQVRTSSLQKTKRYSSERVSMLQKKCLMLQLQIDSKTQQLQSHILRIRHLQSQLCESLAKIERLQKSKSEPHYGQQLKDFQTEERENGQGDYLLLKKLEEKERKIIEMGQQQKITQGEINIKQSGFVGDLQLQQSQKDMEIIKLKRQIIELLQQQSLHTRPNTIEEKFKVEQINSKLDSNIDKQMINFSQLKEYNFNSLQNIVSKWVRYQSTIKKLQQQNEQSTREIESLRRQLSLSRYQYEQLSRQLKESMNLIGDRESGSENQESGEQMRVMNVLSGNYNSLLMQMRGISNKVDVLVGEKEALTKLIHQHQSTIQQQRHTLQQQDQFYRNSLSLKSKQLQSLSLQMVNLKQQLTQLQSQNGQSSVKSKQLETSLRTNNQNHQLEIINFERQHVELVSKLNRDSQQLRVRIQQLMGENARLINVHTVEREKVEQLLTEISEIKHREILYNNQSLQRTQYIHNINQKHAKYIITTQKDKAELKQQILNLQKHNQILTIRCQTLTNNFKQILTNYENKLGQQIKTKQQQIKIKQQEIKLKSQQILLKEQQLNFKNQQLEQLYQELNINKQQLASNISQIKKLTFKLNQCEQQNTKLNHKLKRFQVNNQLQLQLSSLKQLNSQLRLQNEQLQSQLRSLTIQLSKELEQKRLIKQQLYNSHQDYLKTIVQLKQQNRKFTQSNSQLTNQNTNLSNQLLTYKSTIKQMAQQIAYLQQQLSAIKQQKEKQQLRVNKQIQSLISSLNQQQQRGTVKDNQILQLKLQLDRMTNQLNSSLTVIRDKQVNYIEFRQKSKQTEMSLRGKLQQLQLIYSKQKGQLIFQLKQIKEDRDKTKMELQVVGKELLFVKSFLQKKEDQILSLHQQVSSQKQTISSLKITHQTIVSSLKHKLQQLQSRLLLNLNSTNLSHQSSQTNSYKTSLQQIEKLLQITTNKLNQSLTEQTNLSCQVNNLNKYISQLQIILEEKIKQIACMEKEIINSDIKLKETQRKSKYELLHLKAQLDMMSKAKQEIEQNCNRVFQDCRRLQQQCRRQDERNKKLLLNQQLNLRQKQSLQQQILTLQTVKKESTQIAALQQQLISTKTQNTKTLAINRQLKQELNSMKQRNQELMIAEMELERVNKDLLFTQKEMEIQGRKNQQFTQTNRQLAQQLDQAKHQLFQIHQEMSRVQQQFKMELQSHRNSQRVLDNQLIQYKSILQNVSQSLRQQNQRSQDMREELQKLRTEKNLTQKQLYLKSQQSAQEQSYLRKEKTRLQRELQHTKNTMSQYHKTLLQTHAHQLTQKDEQISYLNQQLLNLTQKNSNFHLNHSLLYENPQYHQHYSIDHMQQQQTHQNISYFIDQCSHLESQSKQQLEYNLLLQVQSKIQILVQENNMLKQKLYHQQKLFIS